MKKAYFLTFAFSVIRLCYGGEAQLFGYFEPQLTGAYVQNDFVTLNSNKLRLDLEAEPTEGVKFGANINYFTYTGKTHYNLLDYLPENLAESIAASTEDFYTFTFSDSIVLDNAYLRMSFHRADLSVGKQQISYGTGYAWNPTDIFNLKDLLDPTYEQPGHSAVRLDVPIGNDLGLMALYSPGENWDESTGLLRLKFRIAHFDLSFSGITTHWASTSYPDFIQNEGWRRLYGWDLVGQLLGLGTWAEVAHNQLEYEKDYWEGIVGLDYTFRSGLYILGEFYYNSNAPNSSDDYTLTDWMRYFTADSKTLGETQGYFYTQYPVTDLISTGWSLIGCISDGSLAVVPQLNYSLFQNVELTCFGNIFLGDEGTTYSRDLGNGGLIRLRAYF